MPLNVVRFQHHQKIQWAIQQDSSLTILDVPCTTTEELIRLGYKAIETLNQSSTEKIDIHSVKLLSPITEDAKILCQGANYRQHMIDSGMDPDDKNFNMFFTKSSAAIHNPNGDIIRPKHVQLLDYEIEVALVVGKKTQSSVKVNDANLSEYIAGICIGNDISARDIQIPQMQFHKGKSYRTFCPLGPVLCLLDKKEMHILNELELTLKINDEIRQSDNTANWVHKPAETISEFSQITNFNLGDVIMTGTPSGCALKLPSPFLVRLGSLLPESKKWALFIKKQLARPQYLQPGDRITSTIHNADKNLDLGEQSHCVIQESS